MKLYWSLALVAIALSMILMTARAEADLWEEDDKEVLVRTVRGTKERSECSLSAINPLLFSSIKLQYYSIEDRLSSVHIYSTHIYIQTA